VFPDYSPDGCKIAHEDDAGGNGDIYVMNADGSDHHDVSNDPSVEFGAAGSPDGSEIAFLSTRTRTRLIHLMNADGSNQHALTGGTQFRPAWQPRGTGSLR
jgi:TolB protein